MIRHQQPSHEFTFKDMAFHDLGNICLSAHPIPDSFRVDHDTGTQLTMIKAPRLVRAYQTLEVEAFSFALEMRVEPGRSQIRAASTRVIFRAFVDANENMSLEGRHIPVELGRHGGGAQTVDEERDVASREKRGCSVDRTEERGNFTQTE